MPELEIVFDPLPGEALSRHIIDQFVAHNVAASGASASYPVGVFRKNSRREWLSSLWGGWLQVRIPWVDTAAHGRGNGARPLRAAEEYAVERGGFGATLETHSFQARPFCEKCGYQVFATPDDYPPGHAKFFLHQRLTDGGAP